MVTILLVHQLQGLKRNVLGGELLQIGSVRVGQKSLGALSVAIDSHNCLVFSTQREMMVRVFSTSILAPFPAENPPRECLMASRAKTTSVDVLYRNTS